MKNKEKASLINNQVKEFLKNNPKIVKALRTFDISYAQYEKALESGIRYYTASSTQVENLCTENNRSK